MVKVHALINQAIKHGVYTHMLFGSCCLTIAGIKTLAFKVLKVRDKHNRPLIFILMVLLAYINYT